MPDDKHYGIIWMKREAMEANFNFEGAFNQVIFHFATEGEDRFRTMRDLDALLDEFGGLGTKERKLLPSDSFLSDEFRQLRTTAVFLPWNFFWSIAAFLFVTSFPIDSYRRNENKSQPYERLVIHRKILFSII